MSEQAAVGATALPPAINLLEAVAEFEAYPNDPFSAAMRQLQTDMFRVAYGEAEGGRQAAAYFEPVSARNSQDRDAQQAGRPLLPLKQFPEVGPSIMSLLKSDAGEQRPISFGTRDKNWGMTKLVNVIARSDDEAAHSDLVELAAGRYDIDGILPVYREKVVEQIIRVATVAYTPDSNPLVHQDIQNIYKRYEQMRVERPDSYHAKAMVETLELAFIRSENLDFEQLLKRSVEARMQHMHTREQFLEYILTLQAFEGAQYYQPVIARLFEEYDPLVALLLKRHVQAGQRGQALGGTRFLTSALDRIVCCEAPKVKDEYESLKLLKVAIPALAYNKDYLEKDAANLLGLIDPERPIALRNLVASSLVKGQYNMRPPLSPFVRGELLLGLLNRVLSQPDFQEQKARTFQDVLYGIDSCLYLTNIPLPQAELEQTLAGLRQMREKYLEVNVPPATRRQVIELTSNLIGTLGCWGSEDADDY